jgi:hypothetical protein
MSLFTPVNLVCPGCKTAILMDAVGSVNADRRPDYRDDILNDHFQDVTCVNCNETFRLQPRFNYLDAGRRQWIAAFPSARLLDWVVAEAEVAELFTTSYGKDAPQAAQDVGVDLDVRMTFGWPAVREKILAREHDLDDGVLELLKLDLIRGVDSAPVSTGVEVRLVGAGDDVLTLVWLDGPTEKPLQEIHVPIEHYKAIADNLEPWQKIYTQLTDSVFVDIQKLYMGQGRNAAE